MGRTAAAALIANAMDRIRLRRRALLGVIAGSPLAVRAAGTVSAPPTPELRWYRMAEAMKRLAVSWGDQPYGAVLVLDGEAVGLGPSRVVVDRDPDAHAERVAIRDAQRRLGRTSLEGSVLYSTSRPCSLCEAAAAAASVGRMIHGPMLDDAGPPARS